MHSIKQSGGSIMLWGWFSLLGWLPGVNWKITIFIIDANPAETLSTVIVAAKGDSEVKMIL